VRAEKSWEEVMSVPGNDHSPPQPTISQRFWDVISSSTFVGLLVFLGSLTGIGILTWVVVTKLNTGFGLPVLALSSVLLLLAALLVFTTLIHLIGLSDPRVLSAYRKDLCEPFLRWHCLVYSRSWRLRFSLVPTHRASPPMNSESRC